MAQQSNKDRLRCNFPNLLCLVYIAAAFIAFTMVPDQLRELEHPVSRIAIFLLFAAHILGFGLAYCLLRLRQTAADLHPDQGACYKRSQMLHQAIRFAVGMAGTYAAGYFILANPDMHQTHLPMAFLGILNGWLIYSTIIRSRPQQLHPC